MKRLFGIFVIAISMMIMVTSCSKDKAKEAVSGQTEQIEGMILVQGGSFRPHRESYDVTLPSFFISKYEITQSEWTSVMDDIYIPNWSFGYGPNHPAYSVSWFDAIEYCNRLSIREGLTGCYSYDDGSDYGTNPDNWPENWNTRDANHTNISYNRNANGYRLPTEMEWEFAARGGIPAQKAGTFNDRWAGTNVEDELGDYAWYENNSGGFLGGNTRPVGTKLPNELGLYDMSGNVSEWCWDLPDLDIYYLFHAKNDVFFRVIRGGGWGSSAVRGRGDFSVSCNVSVQGFADVADRRIVSIGFRCVRRVE